ncbi:MAG TPA: ornithine carbamoyltransferase [Acidimicrobiia bacterium]|nr:ornithine carbamoyltransferase [Acidimicrobiia bacterium]
MSLLSIAETTPEALRAILELGGRVKADPGSYRTALSGRSIGLFFQKQSLRTWVSCDVAAIQLGIHPIVIRNDQTGLGVRETPEDVGRVLERYLDLLGMRVFDHADLEAIDRVTAMPLVNLLSDREHPCQAIADLMTLAEHRPIEGSRVAYLGDGNNVCHSLMLGVVRAGGAITVAAPPGYEPDEAIVELARRDGDVTLVDDPRAAVEGADAVYTDVWASMGQESEAALRRRHFARFQVDDALMEAAGPEAIFLHCLPAHRGEEVTDSVMESARSRVFDQAENRLHAFKAILLHLLG